MNRGMTLIELMIALAVLMTLVAGAVGAQSASLEKQAVELLQRERALQCLEYEASVLLRKGSANPTERAALLNGLLEGVVESRSDGSTTTFTVRWQSPRGAAERSLTVIGRAR
jgi:prepilin-type N-terminal cleavage/methylation domain-containing protein